MEDSAAYGDIFGDLAMRKALVEEMKYVYSGNEARVVDVKIEDMALTAGCNAAFMAAVMAVAEKGDEFILPVPWCVSLALSNSIDSLFRILQVLQPTVCLLRLASIVNTLRDDEIFRMTLQMLGVQVIPLPVSIESGFIPTVDHAEALITPRTRAIVLVSPNNPVSTSNLFQSHYFLKPAAPPNQTGVTYSPSLIQSFTQLASKHNIALILDETYRDFVEPGPPHNLFTPRDGWDWRSTFVHLFSFSKSYRVPGHRLGAIVGGTAFLENVAKVIDCMQASSLFSSKITLKSTDIMPADLPLTPPTNRSPPSPAKLTSRPRQAIRRAFQATRSLP